MKTATTCTRISTTTRSERANDKRGVEERPLSIHGGWRGRGGVKGREEGFLVVGKKRRRGEGKRERGIGRNDRSMRERKKKRD